MLARAFKQQLMRHAPLAKVWAPSRSTLDVCDSNAIANAIAFEPEILLHCAAKVDADLCETDPELARTSIVGGTKNMVDVCARSGATMVYPQSFLIFDGTEDPITEASKPQPMSVYGQMKAEAERLVLAQLPNALVVRMGGFFGGAEADTNFVGKVVPHLAKLVKDNKKSIEIGTRVWQPTYTADLALNTLELVARKLTGVYCIASHGEASFYELTQEIVKIMSIDYCMDVQPIDASVLANRENARRPLRAAMDNRRLRDEGLDLQRPWQVALAEYLNQPYFKNMFL
jgi:dTDP-4-dehydrorhamnose reductase